MYKLHAFKLASSRTGLKMVSMNDKLNDCNLTETPT